MKLLIYDKFWDSLIKLPRGAQKKVADFQKKFRENSKASGIHLEPISTFKDPTLRTARVDRNYRAIIKAPKTGDVFYLLWVDSHDEAYKWATNKIFQWNYITQSVQVFNAPEVDLQPEEIEPLEQIQKAFFNMIDAEKLIKIGVPEVLLPSIQKIDTFSDLEGVEEYIPSDVFEYLFYLLEGATIDDLIHEINAGRIDEKDHDKQVDSINNQRSFIELTDDSLFNEALSGCLNKWKHYLHPSQRKLVNGDFKGSVKVSGGAGTGKTVAALHRLKFLRETKQPNEKIVFTTYTRALTENLSNLITGLSIDTKGVTIMNIDQVVLGLIKDYKLLPVEYKVFEYHSVKKSIDLWEEIVEEELTSYSPEFLEAEYKQVVLNSALSSFDEYVRIPRKGRGKPVSRRQRKEIWGFVEKFKSLSESKKLYYRDELFNTLTRHLNNKEKKSFDYCLVDELQDFSNVELRLVRSLVPEKSNDLFMVGDPMQSIYSKRINFTQAGINIRGKKSHRLRINYRTTEEIKKLAVSVIQDCHYDNFEGEEEEKAGYVSLFHGSKPTYTVHKTKDTEVSSVFAAITNLIESGYQYSDVAVCARTKSGLKEFRNALHKQKVPYDANDSDKFSTGNAVSLLTFHKIKGLEFKHVFIVDVNDRTVPKLPYDFDDYEKDAQSNYLRNEKSMVYVAVSRAIENVTITGTGRKSEFLKV